jgi:hypothetical protein
MSVANLLLEKLGFRPLVEGHDIGCPCSTCHGVREQRTAELIERRSRGISGNTLADVLLDHRVLVIDSKVLNDASPQQSFWLGVTSERLSVLRGRDEVTLAWASERGWTNSLRAEHGRQQRGIDAHEADIRRANVRLFFPLQFWQGVLCERYVMLAEGRLSVADKRRMGLRWFTTEENIADMMIELMHSMGRIGPNGVAWMTEQLHHRGGADKNYVYDKQRARDILRAACNLMESTP